VVIVLGGDVLVCHGGWCRGKPDFGVVAWTFACWTVTWPVGMALSAISDTDEGDVFVFGAALYRPGEIPAG